MNEAPPPSPQARKSDHREPPPFLGTWPRVYWAVIAYLILLISGLYLFTKAFNQ